MVDPDPYRRSLRAPAIGDPASVGERPQAEAEPTGPSGCRV